MRGRSQNLWRLPKERTVPTFSRETLRLCLESIFWRGVDRQERRTLLAVLRRDSGESGLSSGAYPPEQRCPKSDERSSEDVVEMDSVSTRKGGDDYVPPVRTEPHDCRADDDRSHSTESVHRRAVLQETVTHAPLVLERSGERLVGEGSRLATARRTTFFARTARPKPGRSDKQGHAEPRRHPQGEHDREEDQRKLPFAWRGLEPAQRVLRIHLIVRAHCSPSPSIDDRWEVRRATSAGSTNGRRSCCALPRSGQLPGMVSPVNRCRVRPSVLGSAAGGRNRGSGEESGTANTCRPAAHFNPGRFVPGSAREVLTL